MVAQSVFTEDEGPELKAKGLSRKQKTAARLIAEENMTQLRIAKEIGVVPETISAWKKIPEFMAEIRSHNAQLDEDSSQLKYSKRRNRVAALDQMLQDYDTIRDQRIQWYADNFPDIPGGQTGRLTHTLKQVGIGAKAQITDMHAIDTALESGYRNALEHIARERGEWQEKRELTGPGGAALIPITEIIVKTPDKPPSNDPD